MSAFNRLHKQQDKVLPFPWNAFPPYIEWAIAYGSAVFPQDSRSADPVRDSISQVNSEVSLWKGEEHEKRALACLEQFCDNYGGPPCRDYLLLVPRKNLLTFHRENLSLHPTHYAWPFRLVGPASVCRFQKAGRGVEVFYNTLVYLDHGDEGKQVLNNMHEKMPKLSKYGVATVEDFQAELTEWSSLFFSGRLHKPVQFYSPKRTRIEHARFWPQLESNRLNAIRAALFLHLDAVFPVKSLLTTICGLSYTGDIRMGIAENPKKLENIVCGQTVELFALYYCLFKKYFPQVRIRGSSIPAKDVERLCDCVNASCVGAADAGLHPSQNVREDPDVRHTEWLPAKRMRLGDCKDSYAALRQELLGGQLTVEVPKADEAARFRWELLRGLPHCIREDIWKRAQCKRMFKRLTGMCVEKGEKPLTSDKTCHSYTQDLCSNTHVRNFPPAESFPASDGYPTPADLVASLTSIVRRSSAISAVKNALTAGPFKMVCGPRHVLCGLLRNAEAGEAVVGQVSGFGCPCKI